MAAGESDVQTAGSTSPTPVQTSPNAVAFDPKLVVPQQTVYLQRNDALTFNFLTNAVALTTSVFYRFLTPEGEIKEGEADFGPFTNSNAGRQPLYEGWLISFGARITGGLPTGGWCFMQLMVERAPSPGSSITRPHAMIWQGFITGNGFNGFPGMVSKDPTDGAGTLRSITGTTPGAGVEINEVVPLQRRWTLLMLRAILTASVTVANRFPSFIIDDGVNTIFQIHTNTAQTANQVAPYHLGPGAGFFNDANGAFILPFPTIVAIKNNFRIRSATVGLQVGDQWTAPQYLVYEWGAWDQ